MTQGPREGCYGILAKVWCEPTVLGMRINLLRTRLFHGAVALVAATFLFTTPALAHDDASPSTDTTSGLTDEQINEMLFGDCLARPPAFTAPLSLRVLPGTPQDAEVTKLRVESANLPITAIEIPYPNWETTLTAGVVEASYVGDLPQSKPPYRFWFWLGLDEALASGGEFSAVVTLTLSDGHTVSHVLDDAADADTSREDMKLPMLRIPYTPNMIRSTEQVDQPDGVSVNVEPCVIGADLSVPNTTTDNVATSSSTSLPLIVGGGFLVLSLGIGAGFAFGRRRS